MLNLQINLISSKEIKLPRRIYQVIKSVSSMEIVMIIKIQINNNKNHMKNSKNEQLVLEDVFEDFKVN